MLKNRQCDFRNMETGDRTDDQLFHFQKCLIRLLLSFDQHLQLYVHVPLLSLRSSNRKPIHIPRASFDFFDQVCISKLHWSSNGMEHVEYFTLLVPVLSTYAESNDIRIELG